MSEDGKVLPFHGRGPKPVEGEFFVPDNACDIVSLMRDLESGELSVVFATLPDRKTAIEIQHADEVDRLGVRLIQLAVQMRGHGGPP